MRSHGLLCRVRVVGLVVWCVVVGSLGEMPKKNRVAGGYCVIGMGGKGFVRIAELTANYISTNQSVWLALLEV